MELHPGLTLVIGTRRSGKTTVAQHILKHASNPDVLRLVFCKFETKQWLKIPNTSVASRSSICRLFNQLKSGDHWMHHDHHILHSIPKIYINMMSALPICLPNDLKIEILKFLPVIVNGFTCKLDAVHRDNTCKVQIVSVNCGSYVVFEEEFDLPALWDNFEIVAHHRHLNVKMIVIRQHDDLTYKESAHAEQVIVTCATTQEKRKLQLRFPNIHFNLKFPFLYDCQTGQCTHIDI
jgi:hypothetical protein